MQIKALLALVFISCFILPAQIAPNRPDSVAPASAIDFQTVPVPVNSVVSIAMTLDPSAGGVMSSTFSWEILGSRFRSFYPRARN